MLRYWMRPPCGAVVLICGSFFLLQTGDGVVRSALAQSREVLVGLSGRAMPAIPDGSIRGPARRGGDLDRSAARELEDARELLSLGNLLEGRRRLEILVARYPTAAASDEARRELARLYAPTADAAGSASERAGQGPGGVQRDGGAHVPVNLGAPAPSSGGAARAQDAWIGEPRMARAAEQDFRLFVGDRVFFGDRSAELGSRARSLLAAQARWLKQVPHATVIVEGHADDQGSAAFNQELAARRAQAVRERLIAEGIDASRITLEVHGRQRPVALCSDGECAAQNRRVVTSLKGTRAATGAIEPRTGMANELRPGAR